MVTKFRYKNKKKKPDISKELDIIYDKIHSMEKLEAIEMYNRTLSQKVKDNVIDSDKKRYILLKHILVKGFYTILLYLIVNHVFGYFGFSMTPEVKQGLDFMVDIVMP